VRGERWPLSSAVGNGRTSSASALTRSLAGSKRVLTSAAIASGSSSPSLSAYARQRRARRIRAQAEIGALQLSCWTWASWLAELPAPRVPGGRFPGSDRARR
jgi:hypothetical protein